MAKRKPKKQKKKHVRKHTVDKTDSMLKDCGDVMVFLGSVLAGWSAFLVGCSCIVALFYDVWTGIGTMIYSTEGVIYGIIILLLGFVFREAADERLYLRKKKSTFAMELRRDLCKVFRNDKFWKNMGLISSVPDGSSIEISVKIGNVVPITKGFRWEFTKAHTYERVKLESKN